MDSELRKLGRTYECLIYRHDPGPVKLDARWKVPESQAPNNVPSVSFFSGAGGLDIGFELAGFNHLASFENNELYVQTLKRNRPRWCVIGPPEHDGDLRAREQIRNILQSVVGVKTPFEGVFHGGPPCQPFSIAANQRFSKSGANFKRVGFAHKDFGTLLFDFVWYVEVFKPRAFLLENVPGLLTVDAGEQLAEALQILRKSGYNLTDPTLVDAADHGVPQSRQRLFVCGWRGNRLFSFPQPEGRKVPCGVAFEKSLSGVENHVTRNHEAESIARYMELKYGQRDKLGRVDRLDPRLPSKAVIAGGESGGGRSHLHPYIPRTLSPRESARLQTFPDSYVFCGPPARQFTQIGNAVPPLLAMKLARAIYDQLFR